MKRKPVIKREAEEVWKDQDEHGFRYVTYREMLHADIASTVYQLTGGSAAVLQAVLASVDAAFDAEPSWAKKLDSPWRRPESDPYAVQTFDGDDVEVKHWTRLN